MSAISQLTPEARLFWNRIPHYDQNRILTHVWCTTCLKAQPVEKAFMFMEHQHLMLKGKCKKCGSDVVRLIESE